MVNPLRRRAAVILFAAVMACGGPQSETAMSETPPSAKSQSKLADGWFEVRLEPNLSLQLREGWSADRAEDGKGPIVFSGPGGARVMVWPMFVARGARMPAPKVVLADFADKAASEFDWSAPAKLGKSGVRMFGQTRGKVAQASFVYTESDAGMAGYWYLTAAAPSAYAGLQPVFARLMEGVRIYGPGASAAVEPAGRAPLQYVDWREPNEGAYTTKVPKDWKVRGGLVRPDPMRLHDVMEIMSDDGDVYVFSGDPSLPVFKTLTQMEAQLGLTEGSRNGAAILMHYIPAADYLPAYIENRFGAQCGRITIDGVTDQKEISGPVNDQLAASTMPGSYQHADVALAHFRCASGAVGMVQMATYITGTHSQFGTEGFGIWLVSGVAGFLGPEERAGEATEVLVKSLSERVVSKQWQRANQELISQIQEMSRQAADQLSAQIASRYRASSSSSSTSSDSSSVGGMSDDLSRCWQNSTMDQTDVVDQTTGQTYKVESGSSYYWINQQGTAIVGTNAPSQPGTDFNQMAELP